MAGRGLRLGWVRRGNGLMNTGLLRAMAYHLLARARSVHLRSARLIGLRKLRDWLGDAILWPPVRPAEQAGPALAPTPDPPD